MSRAQLPTAARLAALTNQQGPHTTAHNYGVHPKTIQRALRDAGYQWQPHTGWTDDNPTTDDDQPPTAGFLYEPQPWLADALCAQTGSELFFPHRGGNAQEAKRICRDCPAQPPCLQWALDHHEMHGIWGGLSPDERNHLLAST